MEGRTQNFENHASIDPLFIATGLLAVFGMVAVIIGVLQAPLSALGVGQAMLSVTLLLVVLRLRRYALTLQDRIIRLEMRIRLERVLPAADFARAGQFTLKQMIALRFASDAELPVLAAAVLAGEVTEPKEIKRRVRDWQADFLRV